MNNCAKCGKTAPSECSKCNSVHYCSKQCQTDAWPQHKKICSVMYISGAFHNGNFMGFLFGLLSRFEVNGRNVGYIKCNIKRVYDEEDNSYCYNGTFEFVKEASEHVERGKNLVEFIYYIDDKEYVIYEKPSIQICNESHDAFKTAGYRLFAIEEEDPIRFVSDQKNFFYVIADGVYPGKR